MRWEVELSFKLDKSSYRLDGGKAERTCSIQALLHASLVAKCLIQWNASVADAMNLEGPAAKRAWDRLADNLTYAAKDPNWRRNPSVLDQYRGWKKHPPS